jgi:hypothetical protein
LRTVLEPGMIPAPLKVISPGRSVLTRRGLLMQAGRLGIEIDLYGPVHFVSRGRSRFAHGMKPSGEGSRSTSLER